MKIIFKTIWELCKTILQILLLASLAGFITYFALTLPEWVKGIIVHTVLGLAIVTLIFGSYLKAKELSNN